MAAEKRKLNLGVPSLILPPGNAELEKAKQRLAQILVLILVACGLVTALAGFARGARDGDNDNQARGTLDQDLCFIPLLSILHHDPVPNLHIHSLSPVPTVIAVSQPLSLGK
jgi:hypothetical protein